jgi:hypothetical protein
MLLAYSGSVSWVAFVMYMLEERKTFVVVVRKSKGKGQLRTGRIILK